MTKRKHKVGTTILLALAPAVALGVTAGALIASNKTPVVTEKIIEPTDETTRIANSKVTSEKWTPAANDKIKYTFAFPGEFSVKGGSVDNLTASATFQYQPAEGAAISFDFIGTINKVTDTTFTITFEKEFTYGVDASICDIYGDSELSLTNFTIKSAEFEYACKQTYKAILTPTIIFDNDHRVFDAKSFELPETTLPFVNGLNKTLPTFLGNNGDTNFVFENDEWETSDEGWYSNNPENHEISFYTEFDDSPEIGKQTKIGFELTFENTTYFKKEMNEEPIIYIKRIS